MGKAIGRSDREGFRKEKPLSVQASILSPLNKILKKEIKFIKVQISKRA